MTIPVIVDLGAVTAAFVGRHLIRSSVIRKRAADQWFIKAKMDHTEVITIFDLKCVVRLVTSHLLIHDCL